MSLPFKALVVPGGLALAGCLLWYTSGSSKPETEDGVVSTVEFTELTEKDEQCARSIATRAPVSDSLDEVQVIVESCEEIEQLQDPVTCQDKPEVAEIIQPDQSSEGVEEIQNPSTCQAEPEVAEIIQPAQSSEKIEEKKITSCLGQCAKPLDLSTLVYAKPFVPRSQVCQPPEKTSSQLVWQTRVPQSLVGRFIGQNGWHVKYVMEKSGAKIVISSANSEEFSIIFVSGKEEQIGTAAAMIIEWFKTYEVDLPPYTPRHELPKTQLQDPSTCQDQPEIVDIGQPTQSSEKIKEVQDILTS